MKFTWMKNSIAVCALSLALVGCGGGGDAGGGSGDGGDGGDAPKIGGGEPEVKAPAADDTHEKAMGDMVGLMGDFATVLESVKDKASAEAGAKSLGEMESKFQAMGERMKALGEPSPEQEKELESKFKGTMEPIMARFMGAAMAIGLNEEVKPIIEPAMMSLQSKLGPPPGAPPAPVPVPVPVPPSVPAVP